MKHPAVLALSLASFFSLALVGCGDDRQHRGHMGGGDATIDMATCNPAVHFQLAGIDESLEKALPVRIKACFDRDCDVLTLSSHQGTKTCTGAPGGPPDQLTSCEIGRDNKLSIVILRVDGADYWDGQEHVAAISVQNTQGLLVDSFSQAVNFSPKPGALNGSCDETVTLSAP